MAFNLDLKNIRSKEQQSSSKIAKERLDFSQSKKGVSPLCSDSSHKLRKDAESKIFVQPTKNSCQQSAKGNGTRSDELVKHMTNLPSYLQRADRGEHIQENPLNFGVLDWAQLEKWKHKQKRTPAKASNYTSFDGGESSSRQATNSSRAASNGKSNKEGLSDFRYVKRSQHFQNEERRKDLDKIDSGVRTFASFLTPEGASLVTNEKRYSRDGEAEKRIEGLQVFNLKKKERNQEFATDRGLPSSTFKSKGVTVGSKKKISSSSNKTKLKDDQLQESDTVVNHKQGHSKPNNIVLLRPREISYGKDKPKINDDQLQDSGIDNNQKQCHSKPNNIVLLRPRDIPQLGSPDIFVRSRARMSFDEILLQSSQSNSSNISLHEDPNSEGVFSEIPHSSELRSMDEPAVTSETIQQRTDTDQGTDYSSVASETPPFSIKSSSLQSEGAYFENDALDNKLTDHCDFSKLKESLDQETAELTAKRGRLSSSHRFSFSLSRIGRSFSFKEGSSLPQFSSSYVSAKSGPVTSVSSARWYSSSKEQENGHNRSRSNSFRRLLDPILKHKASKVRHSTESSLTQKGSLDSISFRTTSFRESLPDEMSEGSSIQALLQVTTENGLPFYKFELINEMQILAAAMQNLASSDKDTLSCYLTFYLLNEIKKKSGGWISHGSREKSCGYVYNVVGRMKFSSSTITKSSNQNSKRLSELKEYVLLGVEDQPDQGPPKVIHSRELAAVVVEIPPENFILKELHWDNNLKRGCSKCLAQDRCTCHSGENDVSISTTVILPGGIHGSPNKGEPSPLIKRWKSGGLCDCGGWDIGCKLLVLSNQKQSSKSHLERFELFVQV